jgi:glycosyltransferase involved in cell wall biosynthesis
MRVLMLSWEYPPNVMGGLGKHVAELIPALTRLNVGIDLVTPLRAGASEVETHGGVRVHRVATNSGPFPDFYTEAQRANRALEQACDHILVQDGPFDLIHNHDWLTSFAAAELKHRHRIPLLSTVHATERGRGRGYLAGEQSQRINDAEWHMMYESWRVICCTEYMADELQSYFSSPADKLDVIPNGVDPSPFQSLDGTDLNGFRAQWAQPDEKIVLYVGRVVHEKGIEELIRSAPSVLKSVPQARYIIAGRGPELDRLRNLVWEMGLSNKVLLPGFIEEEDRNRLYKVADCAVFPSLYEPFGIVALEAMAAGTPVVVSEVGGLREVVRHAETGITIYPGDPESCAWGIIHTLQHPKWAAQRVENALLDVEQRFNWDIIARQTADVYTRIVEERLKTSW